MNIPTHTNHNRNGRKLQMATLEQRLMSEGHDLNAPAFRAAIKAAEDAAEDAVQREGLEDPEFERKAQALSEHGALAVMWQVVIIRSGIGPFLNLLIIGFDFWRVSDTINQIMPVIPAYVFGLVIILMFTYLALERAEWVYETRGRRQRFSLAQVRRACVYFWNGRDTEFGKIDDADHKAREMASFMRFFKATLFLAFMGSVITAPADAMLPAFTMALFSLIAIVGLEKQLERQYFIYRARFGGTIQSESFFVERERSYLERRQQARLQARYTALYQIYLKAPNE